MKEWRGGGGGEGGVVGREERVIEIGWSQFHLMVCVSLVPRPSQKEGEGSVEYSTTSLVSCPDHTPRGERRSGERSRISWAYYRNAVRTNEVC